VALNGRRKKKKGERGGNRGGRSTGGKESVRVLEAKLCAVRDIQTNNSSHAG